ncbi:tRNA dimethylallyltransferase [endosymbiont of Sipalinus gigas]|uniref:tRNA (adenosine(37)-N6)-dimethylallyltransferase MiaA n=1 Tax=endosymbiont of Sipalinus gigas TaxID=1972134 RepID=UPI000DC7287A|nr:tRNA (adenosine(37)-N6)-dimethylallyltransferase MiaA [endosymbiont of Sipalinus gigas]BBA85335.1 tRNA dimethylallyltransferase [endosymbiont of Sipalinus gigas]
MNIKFKNNIKDIILIIGPTSSGKTDLSIYLKDIFYNHIELISVDSALIYRDMNIGTDKPDKYTLLKFPYKLINIKDPSQSCSVYEFCNYLYYEIDNILKLNKIPILVGGTMFYFKYFLNEFSIFNKNDFIKENIISYIKKYNINNIYDFIKINKNINININDYNRIIRYMEICLSNSNKKLIKFKYNINKFFILKEKRILKKKIKFRFYKMLDIGLENEVKCLFDRKDLNINMQSIKCIGYNEMWMYIDNKISYKEMINLSINSTINLLNNQFSYIKKWNDCIFIDNDILSKKILVNKIIEIINKKINLRLK